MENKKLKKDIKKYIKNIKRNLPCVNKTMQDLIKKMQKSIEVYVYENNVENIKEIEKHFGTSKSVAEEFAVGLDSNYVKAYKFKRRTVTVFLSILAAILVVIALLSVYIVAENEKHTPAFYSDVIVYEEI